MSHQVIPWHSCIPAEPASVSPGEAIVTLPRPSVSTSGLSVHPQLPGGLVIPCFHFFQKSGHFTQFSNFAAAEPHHPAATNEDVGGPQGSTTPESAA
jgi:hypothetical protein